MGAIGGLTQLGAVAAAGKDADALKTSCINVNIYTWD